MRIEKASLKHLPEFKDYVAACLNGGWCIYETGEDFSESFLRNRIDYDKGMNLPAGWPSSTMYFCLVGKKIAGAIRVRHGTNSKIENEVGHIGYETSPAMRGKGVAQYMLKWVQKNIISEEVLVTCDIDNKASEKVITNCQGEYIDEKLLSDENIKISRYKLKPVH